MITLEPPGKNTDSSTGDKVRGPNALEGILALFIVSVLVAMGLVSFNSNMKHTNRWRRMTACQSNLKNIGIALEMYATDNSGQYPPALSSLTPGYLKSIPMCPEVNTDVYSLSYSTDADSKTFTIYCAGKNHAQLGVPENYPQYDSITGFMPRPGYATPVAVVPSSSPSPSLSPAEKPSAGPGEVKENKVTK